MIPVSDQRVAAVAARLNMDRMLHISWWVPVSIVRDSARAFMIVGCKFGSEDIILRMKRFAVATPHHFLSAPQQTITGGDDWQGVEDCAHIIDALEVSTGGFCLLNHRGDLWSNRFAHGSKDKGPHAFAKFAIGFSIKFRCAF